MDDLTPEQRIEYSRRLQEFLKDDAVVYARAGLKRNYFESFQKPNLTSEALNYLHAKVRALTDIGDALQSVIDAGKIAKAQQEAAEKQQSQAQRPRR